MDLELSADQELLRQTVRRFLAEQAPISYVRAQLDDPRGTSDEVWKGLADLGLTGLLVPEKHGGSGMGMVEMGVVLGELGRAVHPGPFLSSAVGAVTMVLGAAGPDDRERLLPALASGSTIGTVALLEPGSRYDWRSPTTTAARHDGWRLTGSKVHVTDALGADLYLVSAAVGTAGPGGRPEGTAGPGGRPEGTAGHDLGVFLVERGEPGVEVVPSPTVDGTRKQATVSLTSAPATRLTAGDASATVARAVHRLTVALVADGVGATERLLEMTLDHGRTRHQFGRPIGSFQAVQHLCADMLQSLELARAGTWFALWADDGAPDATRHRAATMAKAYASEALPRAAATAIQIFGGIGFTWDHDAHLFYKRLLTMAHGLGGAAEHLEELAGLVLDGAPDP